MADKPFIIIGPTKQAILQSAATIYAGYVASGAAQEDGESELLARSAKEAIRLAETIDHAIVADGEMG